MKYSDVLRVVIIAICVVFCAGCKSSSTQKETNVIHVDVKNASAYDISDMMDTSFFRVVATRTLYTCSIDMSSTFLKKVFKKILTH